MRILGVDPGNTGALVLMEDGKPIEWMRMPTYQDGDNTRVNAVYVADWIKNMNRADGIDYACIEQVHSMPKQGVKSMFTFGHAAGVVTGVIAALEIPIVLVSPRFWKKQADLVKKEKDASRVKAMLMWPEWKDLNKKAAGQALADAAFIAIYGEYK